MAKQSRIFGPGLFELDVQVRIGQQVQNLGTMSFPFWGEYQNREAQLPRKLFGLNQLAERLKEGPIPIDEFAASLEGINTQYEKHFRDVVGSAFDLRMGNIVRDLGRANGLRVDTNPLPGRIAVSDYLDAMEAANPGRRFIARFTGHGNSSTFTAISRAQSTRLAIDMDVDPFKYMEGSFKTSRNISFGGQSFGIRGIGQLTKPPFTGDTISELVEVPHNLLWRPRDASVAGLSSLVGEMVQKQAGTSKADLISSFTRKGADSSLVGQLYNRLYARQSFQLMQRFPGAVTETDRASLWVFDPLLKMAQEGVLKQGSKGLATDLNSVLSMGFPQFTPEGLALMRKDFTNIDPTRAISLFDAARTSNLSYNSGSIRNTLFRGALNLDISSDIFKRDFETGGFFFSNVNPTRGQFTSTHGGLADAIRAQLPKGIRESDSAIAETLSEMAYLKTRPQNAVASRVWKKILYGKNNSIGFLRADAIETPRLPGLLSSVENIHAISFRSPFADDLTGWIPTTGGVKNIGGINYGTTAVLPPTVTLSENGYSVSSGIDTMRDLFERLDQKRLMIGSKEEIARGIGRVWGHAEGAFSPQRLVQGIQGLPGVQYSKNAANDLERIATTTNIPLENIKGALSRELERVGGIKGLAGSNVLDPFIMKYDMVENGRVFEYIRSSLSQLAGTLGSEVDVAFRPGTGAGTRIISGLGTEGIARFANVHLANTFSTESAYWAENAFGRLHDLTGGNVSQYFSASKLMPGSFSRALFTEGWGDQYSSPRRLGKNISQVTNSFSARANILLADFDDLSAGGYPWGETSGSYNHPGASVAFETPEGYNLYSTAYGAREGGGPVHTNAAMVGEFDTPNYGVDMLGNPKTGYTRSATTVPEFSKGTKWSSLWGDKIQPVPIQDVLDANGNSLGVHYVYSIGEAREKGTLPTLLAKMTGQKPPEDPGQAATWAEEVLSKMKTDYQLVNQDGTRSQVAKGFMARNFEMTFADSLGHVYPEDAWRSFSGLDAPSLMNESFRFMEQLAGRPKNSMQEQGLNMVRNVMANAETTGMVETILPTIRYNQTMSARAAAAAKTRSFTPFALELGAKTKGARIAQVQEMIRNFVMRLG